MINNIFNIRTNDLSDAACFNLGGAMNVGQRSVNKAAGGFSPIGDFVASMDAEANVFIDPDVGDTQGVI